MSKPTMYVVVCDIPIGGRFKLDPLDATEWTVLNYQRGALMVMAERVEPETGTTMILPAVTLVSVERDL